MPYKEIIRCGWIVPFWALKRTHQYSTSSWSEYPHTNTEVLIVETYSGIPRFYKKPVSLMVYTYIYIWTYTFIYLLWLYIYIGKNFKNMIATSLQIIFSKINSPQKFVLRLGNNCNLSTLICYGPNEPTHSIVCHVAGGKVWSCWGRACVVGGEVLKQDIGGWWQTAIFKTLVYDIMMMHKYMYIYILYHIYTYVYPH